MYSKVNTFLAIFLYAVIISGCKKDHCSDGVKNKGETGIDCGSSDCPPCSNTNIIVHNTNNNQSGNIIQYYRDPEIKGKWVLDSLMNEHGQFSTYEDTCGGNTIGPVDVSTYEYEEFQDSIQIWFTCFHGEVERWYHTSKASNIVYIHSLEIDSEVDTIHYEIEGNLLTTRQFILDSTRTSWYHKE